MPKAPGTTGGRDNRLIAMLALGGVALLAVIGIGAALAFGGGDDGPDARTALEAAGCTLTVKPAVVERRGLTPTSRTGARKPEMEHGSADEWTALRSDRRLRRLQRAAADRPARPQPRARCHRILYGDEVPDETVQQLTGFSTATIRGGRSSRPIQGLESRSRSVPGSLAGLDEAKSERGSGVPRKCPDFDESAFDAFFDALQFEGPEAFPPESLLPGRN